MKSKHSKSFESPDETIEFPGIREEIVDLGDASVARVVQEPGWRWSRDTRSVVEGEWCEAQLTTLALTDVVGSTQMLTSIGDADRGLFDLKGLPGKRRLFAYAT